MKSTFQLLGVLLVVSVLFSCSPRVVTQVIKSYPSLPASEEVTVYNRDNNDSIPASAETLGNIAVVDGGFATRKNGSFDKVVKLASDATRENGGNALLITDHIKPSFWRSTIHQIGGVMLRVNPNDTVTVSSQKAYVSLEENSKRRQQFVPAHTLLLNAGYGGLPQKTKGLSAAQQELETKLSNGLTWDIGYTYHHRGYPLGVGLIASQYYSSPFGKTVFQGAEQNVRLDYAGVSLSGKYGLGKDWFFTALYGIGYLGYTHSFIDQGSSRRGSITAATLGMNFSIGVERKFSKHWGAAFDLSTVVGYFNSINFNNISPAPDVPKINKENRLNASRSNVTLGLRYYL
ncbi:MAG: hypothetical protein Q4G63_06040 [Bacteroidia bacterium]|nr:hypothetical protein [Bacteroidia bacterium]